MVDRNVVSAKLAELADKVARVRARVPATAAELAADRDALDLVSFNLMLAVQACADIASHIIADECWTPAGTLGDAFARLSAHRAISENTREALSRAIGLRNIVAHGYAGVDPARVHAAAISGLADLEAFSREIAGWLVAQLPAR